MATQVDLYDSAYGRYTEDVYRQVRIETYGEDLGQTSWVTGEESREIPGLLKLTRDCHVLEVGCGSGRYALRVAEATGCRITGVDINEAGIRNASRLAAAQNVDGRVRFQRCDAARGLPFPDANFGAAFANDVMCHIPDRVEVLRELFRVLTPGGRLVFSDALVIGGAISHEEIAARSSIGYYLFSPPEHNERLIDQAGFRLVDARDSTANAALIAQRWRNAREKRAEALIAAEGKSNFDGVQRFLACVHMLTSQRRLLRFLYTAEKPD